MAYIYILTGVVRRLLGPHDTLPCVLQGVVTSILSVETLTTGIKIQSSDQAKKKKNQAIKGLLHSESSDQGSFAQ